MLERLRKTIDGIAGAIAARSLRSWKPQTRASMRRSPRRSRRRAAVTRSSSRASASWCKSRVRWSPLLAFNLVYLPIQPRRRARRPHPGAPARRGGSRAYDARLPATARRSGHDATRTVAASGDFSLFSVVEQALTRRRAKTRSARLHRPRRPSRRDDAVHGRQLNALSLPQIVDTLYGLSALSVPVTVSTLHVTRRSQDQHTFDVEMTCVALGRNG